MEYKEIYDELRTVLWGDEIAETIVEGEIGVDEGYLVNLRNQSHIGGFPAKIDRLNHDRLIRICKKFADKLYLETKDKYVIDILFEICAFVGDGCGFIDMGEVCGTSDDPTLFFCDYKPEEAVEPKPEDKYSLIFRTKRANEIIEEIKNFKFYEDAKRYLDEKVKEFKNGRRALFCFSENADAELAKYLKDAGTIDEPNHFKCEYYELIIKKRI